MADTTKRVAVVEREIEGTDIHGDDVIIDPGRYSILTGGEDWPGVTILRVEVDGRAHAVGVRTQDVVVEEVRRG